MNEPIRLSGQYEQANVMRGSSVGHSVERASARPEAKKLPAARIVQRKS
jgi:hypothetical protein